MKWVDLIAKNDGKPSHDKLWSNVGSLIICTLFSWYVGAHIKTLDASAFVELIVTFSGIFIVRVAASGLIDIKRASTAQTGAPNGPKSE